MSDQRSTMDEVIWMFRRGYETAPTVCEDQWSIEIMIRGVASIEGNYIKVLILDKDRSFRHQRLNL